jgi:hypothetical protein
MDLIFSNCFRRNEPGVFSEVRDLPLTCGDFYMPLPDVTSCLQADQPTTKLYADPDPRARELQQLSIATRQGRPVSEYRSVNQVFCVHADEREICRGQLLPLRCSSWRCED